jgi:hypothetical protein
MAIWVLRRDTAFGIALHSMLVYRGASHISHFTLKAGFTNVQVPHLRLAATAVVVVAPGSVADTSADADENNNTKKMKNLKSQRGRSVTDGAKSTFPARSYDHPQATPPLNTVTAAATLAVGSGIEPVLAPGGTPISGTKRRAGMTVFAKPAAGLVRNDTGEKRYFHVNAVLSATNGHRASTLYEMYS